MESIHRLLNIFSNKFPILNNISIDIIPFNNLYVARCIVDTIGDFVPVKKGRIQHVTPTKIILTKRVFDLSLEKILIIFTHECAHAITPRRERKVKNQFIRIDHSRQFYENFFLLIKIANNNNIIHTTFDNVEQLMNFDNRKDNVTNDYRLYKKHF